jgi:Raf kinase inhibitor-like YbhB/YbcL family protein
MVTMVITTDGFGPGERIPDKYTCEGRDISPALRWKSVPAGTQSLALILDDPDAPMGKFTHWVVCNIPPDKGGLPEGAPMRAVLPDKSRQGVTGFGREGYGGPCPPPGKPHHYYFRLYALDLKIELPPGFRQKDLEEAMRGHILAQGELMGTYSRG